MVESLQKLREPAVVVLLVVLGLRLVLAVVGLVVGVRSQARDETTAPVLAFAAATAVDGLAVVVLALLLGSCGLWRPTRHARALTGVAVVVVALTLLLSLGAGVASIAASDRGSVTWVDLAGVFLALPVPALALLGLLRLLGSRPAGGPEQLSLPASADDEADQPALQSAPDPAQQPTWQPDQAAGAAWLTAGDAAAGAAASRWGTPEDADGWQPRGDRTDPQSRGDRSDHRWTDPADAPAPPARPGADETARP